MPESRYETPEDESSYLFSSTPGRDIYEISLRITDQTPRFFAMKYVHVGAEEANAVDWGVWSSAIGKSLSRQFISDEMQWHELRMEGGTDLVIHGGIKSRDAVNIIYMGLFSDRSVPRPSCYSRTMALSSWQLRLSIRHEREPAPVTEMSALSPLISAIPRLSPNAMYILPERISLGDESLCYFSSSPGYR
ncbi:hypothetical protein WG66_005363 [Moniliophthora roreri]|nr:hypothetical protein WG66_005363 [Moniliophthora roreri]